MAEIRKFENWAVILMAIALAIFLFVKRYEMHRDLKAAAGSGIIAVKKADEGKKAEETIKTDATVAASDDAKAVQAAATIADLKRQLLAARRTIAPISGPIAPITPSNSGQSSVDAAQKVIDAQDAQHGLDLQRIADRDQQLKDQTAATAAWKASAMASQAENAKLRAAAGLAPKWGAGALYGSSGTAGGYVERSFGAVQVGMSVVRHQIAGGQYTLEAIASAGIRF